MKSSSSDLRFCEGAMVVFCLSPGAVLAETLRRGLLQGFTPALLVQIGSLVGDAVWAVIGLTGIALLIQHDSTEASMKPAKNISVCPWLGVAPTIPDSALPKAPQ